MARGSPARVLARTPRSEPVQNSFTLFRITLVVICLSALNTNLERTHIKTGFLIFGNSGYTRQMRETDWAKVLGWPGYRVYRHEINEAPKTLKL